MIRFILNEKDIATDLPPGMVVLDFIRYHQHLMGTKIGCREGDCGACTVLVGELVNDRLRYRSMTSCLMPLGNAHGKHIVTIEGINFKDQLNPIQQSMTEAGATQCGFCTPGFIMSLAGFCLSDAEPSYQNAIAAIDGNICRCTGYKSIERAAKKISEIMSSRNGEETAEFVAKEAILPAYMTTILTRLQLLGNGQVENKQSATVLANVGGGTDLYVQKHDEMTHASIDFLFDRTLLNGISSEGDICSIGPSATVTDLKQSPIIQEAFPGFHQWAKLVSSTPIRNMATIAGNFVNASPIGDFTIFFLALDAGLTLRSANRNRRNINLRDFYKGYKHLDKRADEIIEKISFRIPAKNSFFNFEKVSKRMHLDIASVNSAMHLQINGDVIKAAGVSAGGVAPIPMFLKKTSAFLEGRRMNEETIQEAIDLARSEISPISDARGTKEYKSLLLGQLMRAHLLSFTQRRKENNDATG